MLENSKQIIQEIKHRADFMESVSIAKNSIPTAGSPVYNRANLNNELPVEKVINHKDGSITVKTPYGFIKAWFRGWESAGYTLDNQYHVIVQHEKDGTPFYNMVTPPNKTPSPTMGGYYELESLLKLYGYDFNNVRLHDKKA